MVKWYNPQVMSDTYAIIRLQGKQHLVTEGQELVVDRLGENEAIAPEVLLIKTAKGLTIGEPIAKGSVTVERVTDQRGEKIVVKKFKAKSRYRRTQGHRQDETVLKVTSIKA